MAVVFESIGAERPASKPIKYGRSRYIA